MQNIIFSEYHHAQNPVRVSLACTQCRSRHSRCDAKMPTCSRCEALEESCTYQKSRRGGRRPRKVTTPGAACNDPHPTNPPGWALEATSTGSGTCECPRYGRSRTSESAQSSSGCTSPISPAPPSSGQFSISTESSFGNLEQDVAGAFGESAFMGEPDALLDAYYHHFHPAHPCALPRFFFTQHMKLDPLALQPVLLVMRYIGSLYAAPASSSSLETKVTAALAAFPTRTTMTAAYHVQALTLYSIAAYWCDEIDRGLGLLDDAISKAVGLGMNLQEFAVEHGNNDPVIAESWRRTWWLIHITDAHLAGSTHTFPFKTGNLYMSVDLPCHEDMYASGSIPLPRSLAEYDMREFAADDCSSFSSFASLIGLTRSLGAVFAQGRQADPKSAASIAASFDASALGWSSLLPHSQQNLLSPDGTLDELLFKAKMLLNIYIVDVHRPLSNLAYCSIESVSHCAPPAPQSLDSSSPDEIWTRDVHTKKTLFGFDKMNELLTLSSSLKSHSPFIICMIANTTVAYLSACRHVFQGQELRLAREKIRLHMGILKALGECWPLARKIYSQVGTIAREILYLTESDAALLSKHITTDDQAGCEAVALPLMVNLDSTFDLINFEALQAMSVNGGMAIPAGDLEYG